MTLILQQLRRCDGSCCRQSPRFPNADGTDCGMRSTTLGKESKGCRLMTGEITLKDDGTKSFAFPERDALQVYVDTCVNWPQNTRPGKDLGDCCWEWVEQ